MRIPASAVCACSGRHPYTSSFDAWVKVLTSNYPAKMAEHKKMLPELNTMQENARTEVKQLPTSAKDIVDEAVNSYERSGDSRFLEGAKGIVTSSTFSQICSEAQCKRGESQEKGGLALAAVRDKAEAARCHVAASVAAVAMTTVRAEGEVQKREIENDSQIPEEAKVDMKRKVEADLAARQETLVLKAAHETKKARILEAPMKQQLTLETELADGVYLTGRMDGVQAVPGEKLIVTEHKHRQRRLFGYVKQYELIQCLAYIHLMRSEQDRLGWDAKTSEILKSGRAAAGTGPFTGAEVTCRLVETYGSTDRADDIVMNEPLWASTVKCLVSRSSKLQAVVSDGNALLCELTNLTVGSETSSSARSVELCSPMN